MMTDGTECCMDIKFFENEPDPSNNQQHKNTKELRSYLNKK
jgi:hypothetical protein